MTVSALTTTTATTSVLSQVGNGEYSAASVSADPTDTAKLGLVKEKDGNYGTANPNAVTATGSPASQSSTAVQVALTTLTLGGA